MKKVFEKFKYDENGNFSIMFGITIVMVMIGMSAAIEINRLSSMKSKLQSVTDMAVLAAAIAASDDNRNREALALAAFEENISNLAIGISLADPTIIFDDATQTVTVDVEAEIESIMAGFIDKKLAVSATSKSGYSIDSVTPISIAFALDVSGSMNGRTGEGLVKIETLQDSIEILFEALENGSKDKDKLVEILRTGMSAYNTALVEDTPMDYGWEDLNDSVGSLIANGGTNSVPALENSYAQLLNDRDYRRKKGEDISNLVEYAIFMTDGDNNQGEWDQESVAICEAMKADGIKLFSIAFAAPETGEALLLDCASGNADAPANSGNDKNNGKGKGKGKGKDKDKGAGKNKDKCMNNGARGKGNAFGHCSEKDVEDIKNLKSDYYHDAEDSTAFKEAFESIGASIAQIYIRLH